VTSILKLDKFIDVTLDILKQITWVTIMSNKNKKVAFLHNCSA